MQAVLTLANCTSRPHVQAEMSTVRDTAPIRFPFNGFTHFFTLSSEFFSSFPHGTCSLSVSCQYLALDEVYHPLRTALSSNPTQWKGITKGKAGNQERGSHPLWQLIPKHLGHRLPGRSLSRLQSSAPLRDTGFKLELFPLHSPLLGESLLVSFPPLNYMLKFSG